MTEHTEQSIRAEVSAWLKANWSADLGLVEWRNKLADSGWGAPHWPKRWHGRDLPVGSLVTLALLLALSKTAWLTAAFGAAWALWESGILDEIPGVWIAIASVIAVGLGLMLAVASGRPVPR